MLSSENLKSEIHKIWPKEGPPSNEIEKYLKKYENDKIVVKCGGSVLIEPKLFDIFIQDIVILKKLGLSPIIVHGGGKRINHKLNELNIQSDFIKGLRVTDVRTINVVKDVLIEFNKEIEKALKEKNCKARSVTTKEYNIISVKPEREELGFVGTPTNINANILNGILKNNEIPVIAPLGLDKNNQVFNINADSAAGAIAKELNARRLLMISDVEGVLNTKKYLIPEITPTQAIKMINDEIIVGGMIPKINTCIDAVSNGVKGVVIIDGRRSHSMLFELFSDQGAGTLIRK